MNTLPRAITGQIFENTESYAALRRHWNALINSDRKHQLSVAHHVLYLALLGKDWRRGFTSITNRRKLDNGGFNDWGLLRAIWALNRPADEAELLAPFDGHVTPAMLQTVREMIPRSRAYSYELKDFAGGVFPFDAYQVPEALLAPASDGEHSHA
jgi:hypothetical protein